MFGLGSIKKRVRRLEYMQGDVEYRCNKECPLCGSTIHSNEYNTMPPYGSSFIWHRAITVTTSEPFKVSMRICRACLDNIKGQMGWWTKGEVRDADKMTAAVGKKAKKKGKKGKV